MTEINYTVCISLTAIVNNDDKPDVQDREAREFIDGDIRFVLDERTSGDIELRVNDVTFE